MSIATLILGESGTGKSASLRNFNPADVLLIQAIPKALPFKAKGWNNNNAKEVGLTILQSDNVQQINRALARTRKDIIIIDDFQYLMGNEFMRRGLEKGYDKFTEIGIHAWEVFNQVTQLPDNKRVYILSHTQTDEFGKTKIKTIGKMLDEKITLEGMLAIVLRTHVSQGEYKFSTQNNGSDTVKSPMGMFEDQLIDNDLKMVDDRICEYYNLTTEETSNG